MPIYEFVCEKCDVTFEELVRVDETAACPKCGSVAHVKRAVSVPASHGLAGDGPKAHVPGRQGGHSCGGGGCGACH